MNASFWSFVFSALMVVSILLELFTPAMGGFTFAAGIMGIASVWFGFQSSGSLGYAMIGVNLALFPLTLWLGVRLMKRSPLVHTSELTGGTQNAPDAPPLSYLMGKEGKTLTPLRPGGSALIADTKMDVMTLGKYVDAGVAVKVIQVEGSKIVVDVL